ncbi:MAG: hypothetical protein ACE5DT_02525 [Nitrosopumilus sp.]
MECKECGKTFLGRYTDFCSMKCYEDHIKNSKKDPSEQKEG